jgi:hypothetical protein
MGGLEGPPKPPRAWKTPGAQAGRPSISRCVLGDLEESPTPPQLFASFSMSFRGSVCRRERSDFTLRSDE